jgi:hypothetical protein
MQSPVTDCVYTKAIIVIVQLGLRITLILLSNMFECLRTGESLIYIPRHVLHMFTDFSMCNVQLQFIRTLVAVTQNLADIN